MKKNIKKDLAILILLNLFKLLIKTSIRLMTKSILNVLCFKEKLYCTKAKILFAASFFTTLIIFIFIKKLNLSLSLILSFFSFFVYSAFFEILSESIKKKVERDRIRFLSKKHKELCKLFDNRLHVVRVKENYITVFSRDLTISDIQKKKANMELYFNREISHIVRKNGNFRYNNIIFNVYTKFEQIYRFDSYLNYVDMRKIKKMELPMVLGIDQDNNYLLADLANVKYLFVAGEAGGGKSVMLNCIIQSLMVFRNDVIFLLIDLKEGVEMSEYINFPNCIICSTPNELKILLETLNSIMINRLNLIRNKSSCKDISAYNSHTSTQNLPYVVFVIDEIAEIKLNSNGGGRSKEETALLQILQKGRAAGIFGIGATQRPGAGQIDTDVRAGFHKSISFGISRIETQRMVKISGTETLKEGEFKTDIINTDTVFKGFLINENENKQKKLPKCNGVYENLKHKLIDSKDFFKIKEKRDIFERKWWHILLLNKYKRLVRTYHLGPGYHQFIKQPQNSVTSEIENISNKINMKKNPKKLHTFSNGTNGTNNQNYNNLLDYISKNKKVPNIKECKSLDITEKQRKTLLKKALEEGFIEKNGQTRYKLNEKIFNGGMKNEV
jgi:hypothetical protein